MEILHITMSSFNLIVIDDLLDIRNTKPWLNEILQDRTRTNTYRIHGHCEQNHQEEQGETGKFKFVLFAMKRKVVFYILDFLFV